METSLRKNQKTAIISLVSYLLLACSFYLLFAFSLAYGMADFNPVVFIPKGEKDFINFFYIICLVQVVILVIGFFTSLVLLSLPKSKALSVTLFCTTTAIIVTILVQITKAIQLIYIPRGKVFGLLGILLSLALMFSLIIAFLQLKMLKRSDKIE